MLVSLRKVEDDRGLIGCRKSKFSFKNLELVVPVDMRSRVWSQYMCACVCVEIKKNRRHQQRGHRRLQEVRFMKQPHLRPLLHQQPEWSVRGQKLWLNYGTRHYIWQMQVMYIYNITHRVVKIKVLMNDSYHFLTSLHRIAGTVCFWVIISTLWPPYWGYQCSPCITPWWGWVKEPGWGFTGGPGLWRIDLTLSVSSLGCEWCHRKVCAGEHKVVPLGWQIPAPPHRVTLWSVAKGKKITSQGRFRIAVS